MKKKNSIKERGKKVPPEIMSMIKRSMATAKQINRILEKQGKTQRDLAEMLGKKESEISKWMRGTQNFTYLTICKIELVLGEQIILTADQAVQNINIIKAVVADSKEQAMCFTTNKETHYIVKEGDKKFTITESASSTTKSQNKLLLTDSCFAN